MLVPRVCVRAVLHIPQFADYRSIDGIRQATKQMSVPRARVRFQVVHLDHLNKAVPRVPSSF